MTLKTRTFLSTTDLSAAELDKVLALAQAGKRSNWRDYAKALEHKVIALMFFNPSLRTRASFQAGIARIGGQSVMLAPGSDSWTLEFEEGAMMYKDRTEHVKDAAQVLSQYFDALCIRSFPKVQSWEEDREDPVLSAFKKYADIPLISMESSLWHPCQALADAVTLQEQLGKNIKKKTFVLTWAPHPRQLPMAVPNSTLLIAAQLGMQVRLACPDGYECAPEVMRHVQETARSTGGSFEVMHVQEEALKGADVIYAKSWTPPQFIGHKELELEHRKALPDWMLDAKSLALGNDPYFMHCLPVRRNIEVGDDVLDSKKSLIMQQAANRLHAQNALMIEMLCTPSSKGDCQL